MRAAIVCCPVSCHDRKSQTLTATIDALDQVVIMGPIRVTAVRIIVVAISSPTEVDVLEILLPISVATTVTFRVVPLPSLNLI